MAANANLGRATTIVVIRFAVTAGFGFVVLTAGLDPGLRSTRRTVAVTRRLDSIHGLDELLVICAVKFFIHTRQEVLLGWGE